MIVNELVAQARYHQIMLNDTLDKLHPLGVDAVAVAKYQSSGAYPTKARVELTLHFMYQEKS